MTTMRDIFRELHDVDCRSAEELFRVVSDLRRRHSEILYSGTITDDLIYYADRHGWIVQLAPGHVRFDVPVLP